MRRWVMAAMLLGALAGPAEAGGLALQTTLAEWQRLSVDAQLGMVSGTVASFGLIGVTCRRVRSVAEYHAALSTHEYIRGSYFLTAMASEMHDDGCRVEPAAFKRFLEAFQGAAE